MSYFVAYAVSEDGPPVDGELVASGTGWLNWGKWVLDHADEFPEAAHLAEQGWLDEETPGSLDALETELERLLHEIGNADLAAITAQLLAGVRAKPEGTVGLLVTDGEPAGDDDDESPFDDDDDDDDDDDGGMLDEADEEEADDDPTAGDDAELRELRLDGILAALADGEHDAADVIANTPSDELRALLE